MMYKVFLADDEPWVMLGIKNLIDWGEEGFIICGEATDGIKAWERICRLNPDLILADIQMPGMTGIELIEKIRQEKMTTEVVFVSGYSDFEYARAGLRLGCAEYLLKPVYEEDLKSALQRIKKRLDEKNKNEQKQVESDEAVNEQSNGYMSEKKVAEQIVEYIQEHYCDLRQQDLADHFCMSNSVVSQLIKKYMGKTYSSYVLDLRIKKAQELLRITNYSITEIAEKVGYNDYFYFVKVFKKATGLSPTAYRRKL